MGKAILTSQRVLFFDSKFMGGAWHVLLRRALTEEAGRKVIDDGPDSWRIRES